MSWRSVKLGEIATMKYGKLPPKETSGDESFPIFTGYRIAGFCDEYLYDQPEVIVVARGVGGTGDVKMSPEKSWITNLSIVLSVDAERIDKRFLFYRLGQEPLKDKLNTGAAQAQITIENLQPYPITIPSFATQRRIADILSAYDYLIENNRRRMTLLEEAARQLYREWFVCLRFPGHEHTRITNGVPEGWESRVLADACESLEGGDWIESKDQGGEDFRLLQISNIGINEFVETGNFRYITEQTFKRLNCRDILPGHILISRMPKPIGRAWLVTEMPWRMITAVDVAIIVPDINVADPYFLTHFLNSPTSLEHCERRAVGATRPRVARRDLASLPLLLPPPQLQRLFREVAEPLNQQRATLYRQNEKLRAARDLLLPRLMSGEIAV